MESLPPEMVLEVSEYISTEDLACLCAVSRKWREMFSRSEIWKKHCDSKLIEPLLTGPCIIELKFVSPERKDSTLTPISHWRLNFLREQHLWKNWKLKNCKVESILLPQNSYQVDFLSDHIIVVWCAYEISIWNVSKSPATFVTKTDFPIDLPYDSRCNVVGDSTLVAVMLTFVLVFHVDIINKNIKLKHNIDLGLHDVSEVDVVLHDYRLQNKKVENRVKGDIFMYVCSAWSGMDIFDLESGEKIRTEFCPEVEDANVTTKIFETKLVSPTSDNVLVVVRLRGPECYRLTGRFYLYNLKQHRFLPTPVVICWSRSLSFEVHGQYLAVEMDPLTIGMYGLRPRPLRIYNYVTSELLFEDSSNVEIIWSHFLNNIFIFLNHDDTCGEACLKMFSLPEKTLTTIFQLSNVDNTLVVNIINNKFIGLLDRDKNVINVWELSGQSLKVINISYPLLGKTNQISTRRFEELSENPEAWRTKISSITIYHYW